MDKEINYRRIMNIAKVLFAEEGVERTTMALIAEKSGVSKRTVFRYFGTKEQLVIELVKSDVDTMNTVINKLVFSVEYQQLTGKKQLLELCRVILDLVTDNSWDYICIEEIETYLIRKRNAHLQELYEKIYVYLLKEASAARQKGLMDKTISSMYEDEDHFYSLCKNLRGFLYRAAIDVQFRPLDEDETEILKREYMILIDKILHV